MEKLSLGMMSVYIVKSSERPENARHGGVKSGDAHGRVDEMMSRTPDDHVHGHVQVPLTEQMEHTLRPASLAMINRRGAENRTCVSWWIVRPANGSLQ